jgi:hypothetical protein
MTRETCYFWSKIWFFFNFNLYCFASACGRFLLFRYFRTEHFFVFLICSSRNEKLPRRRKLSIDPQNTEYNCHGLFGKIKTNNWNEIFLCFFSFLRLVFHIILTFFIGWFKVAIFGIERKYCSSCLFRGFWNLWHFVHFVNYTH